jgi:hypothetical protein
MADEWRDVTDFPPPPVGEPFLGWNPQHGVFEAIWFPPSTAMPVSEYAAYKERGWAQYLPPTKWRDMPAGPPLIDALQVEER